jgi:hypothetical protein
VFDGELWAVGCGLWGTKTVDCWKLVWCLPVPIAVQDGMKEKCKQEKIIFELLFEAFLLSLLTFTFFSSSPQ